MARIRGRGAFGAVVRALRRTPLRRLLESDVAYDLRRHFFGIRQKGAIAVLDALQDAGVEAWVAGGWGVDALLGRQNRRHLDLDLVIHPSDLAAARACLSSLGITYTDPDAFGGGWLPDVVKMTDRSGRVVDLLPIEPGGLPASNPFTTGALDDQPVPCLSPELQVTLHEGYPPSWADRRDMARLCARYEVGLPLFPPGRFARAARRAARNGRRLRRKVLGSGRPRESALLVPVPEAEAPAAGWREHRDPAGSDGIPPHITLLLPFVPPDRIDAAVEDRVARVLTRYPAFSFRLDRIDRFPGIVYLAPSPPERFVELTEILTTYWPEHPPYNGAYEQVIPHLTVADGPEPPGLDDALRRALPIDATVTEVWLVTEDERGHWSVRRKFPLGRAPAP